MPVYTDAFSGRSQFSLSFRVSPRAYNLAGNYTDVEVELDVVETTSSPSYFYTPQPWTCSVDGQSWSGSAALDFRASGLQTIGLKGMTTKRVYHNADGYATINLSASMTTDTVFGNAAISSRSLVLTRIPKPPDAPRISGTVGTTVLGPQDITTTSMVVKFSATDNNGATTDAWQLQYADNSAFTNATTISSTGTSTVTGLTPGKTYYFRARGHNVAGWGAWSATASAKTVSAVYVSDGTEWLPAELYVSDGTTWHGVGIAVSDGTAWQDPLPA